MHKFLGDFLQTDEVGIAAAQHFENALEAGALVVRLKPDVIGEDG